MSIRKIKIHNFKIFSDFKIELGSGSVATLTRTDREQFEPMLNHWEKQHQEWLKEKTFRNDGSWS